MAYEIVPHLKVRLVLDQENSGWILEKFAKRLVEHLGTWNIEADISEKPSENVDINHWLLYLHYQGKNLHLSRNTVLITHIDRPSKLKILGDNISELDFGICLSRMTMDFLVAHGIPSHKLCYITPGHDGIIKPRRINIGITSRIYNDGRKREGLLINLAEAMDLSDFHFDIIGEGWETIIEHLKKSGAGVNYFPGSGDYLKDYHIICERIPNFDFYLYTGMDEGSMGFLDALSAGIPTIVTPQGFHKDIRDGITHSFETSEQLIKVFRDIGKDRKQRSKSVGHLTWKEYARLHAILWRMIVLGKTENISDALYVDHAEINSQKRRSLAEKIKDDVRFFSIPILRRIGRLLKGRK